MKHSTLMTRQSSWTPGRWLLGILVSLVLGSMPVYAASAPGPVAEDFSGKITLQDGKLTARNLAAPLWQIMEELSRLSGAQVRWLAAKVREQEVSVTFNDLPLAEAVRRLLSATNFLLLSTASGGRTELTQIWITAREGGRGQPVRARHLVPHGQPTPRAGEGAQGDAVRQTPMSEAEAAQDVQQAPEALLQIAMSEVDLDARIRALESLERYAREDQWVRATLADLAHNDADPQV
jgi:hypothetical protein